MLKAVVIDDEYIVLKGLENMIDWSGFGIQLVGTASDGLSGLELIRSLRPDLILTDIRMPGMDGLELMEIVLQETPHVYCIVFSGFNEFEYVKKAIQVGVSDYIEKPITIQSIQRAIQKAIPNIRELQETNELKGRWAHSKQELLEKATLDLLLIGPDAELKWREIFGEDHARVESVTVLCALEKYVISEGVGYSSLSVQNGSEQLIVILHYQHDLQDFWDALYLCVDQGERTVGVGQTYPGLSDAGISYREAQRAHRNARYLDMKGLVRFKDIEEFITSPNGLTEQEEAIILSLRTGNKAGFLEQVDRFLVWIQAEKLDPEVAEREMLKIIYLALEVSKEMEAYDPTMISGDFLPHLEIQEMARKGQLMEWFRNRLEWIADLFMTYRETSKHSAVEKARRYIEQNISSDLSLQEVAAYVGMNTAYLSVLFKEVMGESYIKFLTRYRVEYAKMLLMKGLKINEVSEKVGYHTYRHFSEVFKKHTGLTPGQYRDQQGNQR
jgi:two-component system response regulator YesN